MPQLVDAIPATEVTETTDPPAMIGSIERRSSSPNYFAHGAITQTPGVLVAGTETP